MAEIKSFEDLKQTAEAVVAEPVAVREPQRDKFGRAYATGRRKDASARVWLKAGSGKIIINGKEYAVDRVLQGGTNYIKLRDIVAALEAAGVCQLEVGNRGNIAVLVSK